MVDIKLLILIRNLYYISDGTRNWHLENLGKQFSLERQLYMLETEIDWLLCATLGRSLGILRIHIFRSFFSWLFVSYTLRYIVCMYEYSFGVRWWLIVFTGILLNLTWHIFFHGQNLKFTEHGDTIGISNIWGGDEMTAVIEREIEMYRSTHNLKPFGLCKRVI